MKGYEALRNSSAWIDVSNRGRIRLTGEDRARLLHAMTTNNIHALRPGEGCYAFFLNAQGKILTDANVLCREDGFFLGTEPETRRKLYEHLDRFIIADDVVLEDMTESTVCIAVEGPQAESTLRAAGAPIPEEANNSADWGSRWVYKLSDDRLRVITHPSDRADLVARLGQEADHEAARISRIERAYPRYGDDILEKHLVQETRLMHAVHFAKGCYIGQEIVERVRARGQVHRGLAAIEIDMPAPPPAGSVIMDAAGAKCGEVTSAVLSPTLGVIGFAYLRVDQLGLDPKPMALDGAAVRIRVGLGRPADH
jgi:folate-binding protein YgfZ